MRWILILMLLLSANTASAATWYVRTDGGTSAQCTGQSDAAYPGSGTVQACAFNNPTWVLPPGRAAVMQGGDTLIIGAGEYKIGNGAPNTTGQTSVCASSWSYDCVLAAVPSGPDAAHPTKIYGKGWDTKATSPPQLYGVERVWQVLSLKDAANVEVKYLEITDHSSCIYNSPDPAKVCRRSSTPFGYQADYGIFATDSSNVLLKDLNIHGLSVGGIKAGRLTDWTLDGVTVRGNAYVGWNGDVGGVGSSNSGTVTFRNSKIEYSGCGEQYPSGEIYGCFSQDQGGYGDGLGTATTGANWVFENAEMSHNVSDGMDLLYHDGTGTITIKNSRFEGNAGNAVKVAADTVIENSILISNCDFFDDNPIAEQGGGTGYTNTAAFNDCRAGGTALATAKWVPGRTTVITNSLITGTSMILIEAGGSTCDGSEQFISRNNIFLGMESWYKKNHGEPGVKSDLFYLDGIGGNGDGPCGTGATKIVLTNQDSIAHNLKYSQCPNASNVLCTDPLLTSIPPYANANDMYTYGERWDVTPTALSPAVNKSSSSAGATVLGSVAIPSVDITGASRPYGSGIDWGPYELGATQAPTTITSILRGILRGTIR